MSLSKPCWVWELCREGKRQKSECRGAGRVGAREGSPQQEAFGDQRGDGGPFGGTGCVQGRRAGILPEAASAACTSRFSWGFSSLGAVSGLPPCFGRCWLVLEAGWSFPTCAAGGRGRDDPRAGLTLSVPISEGLLLSGHSARLKVKMYIVVVTPHSTSILCVTQLLFLVKKLESRLILTMREAAPVGYSISPGRGPSAPWAW